MNRDELLERALSLSDEDDWQGAADLLRDNLGDLPDDPAVHCSLGVAEHELGIGGIAYERLWMRSSPRRSRRGCNRTGQNRVRDARTSATACDRWRSLAVTAVEDRLDAGHEAVTSMLYEDPAHAMLSSLLRERP